MKLIPRIYWATAFILRVSVVLGHVSIYHWFVGHNPCSFLLASCQTWHSLNTFSDLVIRIRHVPDLTDIFRTLHSLLRGRSRWRTSSINNYFRKAVKNLLTESSKAMWHLLLMNWICQQKQETGYILPQVVWTHFPGLTSHWVCSVAKKKLARLLNNSLYFYMFLTTFR